MIQPRRGKRELMRTAKEVFPASSRQKVMARSVPPRSVCHFVFAEGYPRPRPSQLTFESERQRFLGLKVYHVTHRVAVDFAAGFAAHLEHHRQIQLNGRVIGRIGSVLDLLKYLAPFTAWGFAVRRPIDIHRVLAKLVLIAAYEVYTVSARLDVVTVQIRSLPTSGTRRLQLQDSPSTAQNSETGDTSQPAMLAECIGDLSLVDQA